MEKYKKMYSSIWGARAHWMLRKIWKRCDSYVMVLTVTRSQPSWKPMGFLEQAELYIYYRADIWIIEEACGWKTAYKDKLYVFLLGLHRYYFFQTKYKCKHMGNSKYRVEIRVLINIGVSFFTTNLQLP